MKLTADDIITALDSMAAKKQKFEEEHPGERMQQCPKCGNRGVYRRCFNEQGVELFGEDMDKPGSYDYFYPCSCVDIRNNQLLKNNKKFSAVPLLYEDALFENFRTDIYSVLGARQTAFNAKRSAEQYVQKFQKFESVGMGLYIYSDSRGSGKTRLSSTIANELTMLGIRVKFDSANRILSEVQKAWNDSSISEKEILDRYTEPRLLIVDDLGARSGKDWMDEKFLMIIDSRYQHKKPTIFTSNYTVDRLPFKDNRIMDRLGDVDRFYFIKLPNETIRKTSRATDGSTSLFYQIAHESEETK